MKTRNGYVSNSSSSSFVIHGWSGLAEDIKDMVLHPQEHIIRIWNDNGLSIDVGHGSRFIKERDSEYDFGFIDEAWDFKENKERDSIEFTTSMNNFDMMKWLDYLKIPYEDLGENWGFFSDEDIEMRLPFEME